MPEIPYIEKLMIFNSVPGPLQDTQKCKNDRSALYYTVQKN